jgi:hypothetical protein
MKSISIRIETVNSAFEPEWEFEVVRILDELSVALEHGKTPERIFDLMGNKVCTVEYEE